MKTKMLNAIPDRRDGPYIHELPAPPLSKHRGPTRRTALEQTIPQALIEFGVTQFLHAPGVI